MSSPKDLVHAVISTRSKWQTASRFKIRHLILLDALGETRNLRLAAEATHSTQPAASRMLKSLEDGVGVALFERTASGLKPNLQGQLMIRYARKILADLSMAREEALQMAHGLSGVVNIGAVLSTASQVLHKGIASLVADYPELQVSIQEGESHMLFEALRRGHLDLMLGRLNPLTEYKDLQYQVIGNEYFVAVAGRNNELAAEQSLRPHDVVEQQWILPPKSTPIRSLIDGFFVRKTGQAPSRVIDSVSLVTNQILLNELNCLTIVPKDAAQEYERAGVLKMLPLDMGEIFGALAIFTIGEATHRGTLALMARIKAAALAQEMVGPCSR